jgi:hypothetical protein
MMEDCQIVKGHDGKYYLFVDDFTGYNNHDIYCVRGDTPTFANPVYVGKVITRSNTRLGGVYYDSINQEYVMIINNFYGIGASTPSIHTYSIPQASFPSGIWVDNGIILTGGSLSSYDYEYATSMASIIDTGDSKLLYLSTSPHRSMNVYYGALAILKNKTTATKLKNNPIINENPTFVGKYGDTYFRTFIKVRDGWVAFYESYNTSNKWCVGAIFLDNSFTPVYELDGSPYFDAANQSFYNPNSHIIEDGKLYVYYQSTPINDTLNYLNQNVAIFDLIY